MGLFDKFKKKPEMKSYSNEYSEKERKLVREITELLKDAPNFTMEQISEMEKQQPTHFQCKDVKNPEEYKFRHLALSYSMAGNFDECIDCCDKGLEINPQSAYLLYMRGRTFSDLKQLEKGIADLAASVQIREDFADAWYEIGRIHHMNNDMDNAILAYYNAQKLEPDYYKIYEDDPNIDEDIAQGETPKFTQTLNEKGVGIVMDFLVNTPEEIDCMVTGYFASRVENKLLPEYILPPYNIRIIVSCQSDQMVRNWVNQLSKLLNDSGITTKFKDTGPTLEIDVMNSDTHDWVTAVVVTGAE